MVGSLQVRDKPKSMRSEGAYVDVAVCTYRRPSIAATLRSLAAQQLPRSITMRVVVADNDDLPSAKSLVDELTLELGVECEYIHAPARNISVARNACLNAARAPFLAFIDDDEEASPTWLSELISRQGETHADAVFGPVVAVYQQDAPAWLRRADLHSIRPVCRPSGGIETGYSCNVLLRCASAADLRFDPALGRSGGEDTVFFHQLRMRGACLDFAPNAIVTERVSAQRLRLGWLLKRSFRNGQTHARILRARDGTGVTHALASLTKAGYCAAVALINVFSPSRSARALVRGALHVGVVGSFLGIADLKLY